MSDTDLPDAAGNSPDETLDDLVEVRLRRSDFAALKRLVDLILEVVNNDGVSDADSARIRLVAAAEAAGRLQIVSDPTSTSGKMLAEISAALGAALVAHSLILTRDGGELVIVLRGESGTLIDALRVPIAASDDDVIARIRAMIDRHACPPIRHRVGDVLARTSSGSCPTFRLITEIREHGYRWEYFDRGFPGVPDEEFLSDPSSDPYMTSEWQLIVRGAMRPAPMVTAVTAQPAPASSAVSDD